MGATIKVEMLGGLSVLIDGIPVLDNFSKIKKPWQVFCFLVLNRNGPSSTARLINALWPDENLSDPANVLKNTVYALRREFKAAKDTKASPILFENGGYICNPTFDFKIDAEDFEHYCKAAIGREGNDKLEMLSKAIDTYKGELLPQLEDEMWVMPLALYYRQLYNDSANELCTGLYEAGRYNELLEAATAGNRIDPLEEKYYVYLFRALYAMEMYRAIIPAYNKTVRIFSEELGVAPGKEIQEIYAAASERVDSIEQDIMIIKDDLREVAGEGGTVSGPLYCTYDVFKYLYQMVARSSERSGGSVVIVLLTLLGTGGQQPSAKLLSAAMNQMKSVILGGLLRKSDTVARYSRSQFIVMLSIEKAGGAEMVIERIQRRCETFLTPNEISLKIATTELEPIG